MLNKSQNLNQALRSLKIADHMTYVTLPLIQDNRILIKIFIEIYKSISNCINTLYPNQAKITPEIQSKNIKDFLQNKAKPIGLSNQQIKEIHRISLLYDKHNQSPLEFIKKEKFVIMNHTNIETLDMSIIKSYLLLAKELFLKINKR